MPCASRSLQRKGLITREKKTTYETKRVFLNQEVLLNDGDPVLRLSAVEERPIWMLLFILGREVTGRHFSEKPGGSILH